MESKGQAPVWLAKARAHSKLMFDCDSLLQRQDVGARGGMEGREGGKGEGRGGET